MPSIHSKANKSYFSGDLIVKCEPLVHVVCDELKEQICDYCASNNQLKKCMGCKQMFYCNKHCQKNDWIYHKLECNLFNKFDRSLGTNARLLLRLYLMVKNDTTIGSKSYELANNEVLSLDQLKASTEDVESDSKQVFDLICTGLTKDYHIDFDRQILFDLYIIVRRYRLYNQVVAIDEPPPKQPESKDTTAAPVSNENTYSCGIYIPMAVFSHSCSPNASYVFNGNQIELRAIKPIDVNQDITISYVDLQASKSDRNQSLKSYDLIDCKCERCESDFDESIDYSRIAAIRKEVKEEMSKLPQIEDSAQSFEKKKQIDAIQEEMLDILKKVYGDYHPTLTVQLSRYYIWKITMELETKDNLKQLHDHIVKSYEITHGLNHAQYKRFVELTSTLE